MKDYYYMLGVSSNSTDREIKTAYRKLATKFHPDKNDGDRFFEERFKDIKEAYEILSSESARKEYNRKFLSKSDIFNDRMFKKYEEDLKKKYRIELSRKEEEIRRKYQAAEQRLKALREQLSAKEAEIRRINKNICWLVSKLNEYKNPEKNKRDSGLLRDNPDILKELEKIKALVSAKDINLFLRMILKYSESHSLSSRYGHEYPHLVKLILSNTIRIKIFRQFFAKYKNNPKILEDFKRQILVQSDFSPF